MLTDQDKKDLLKVFGDISDSMTRVSGEKDFIKETVEALHDKYDIPKKYLKKMANIHHKQNLNEVTAEINEIEELYNEINL